MWQIVRQDLRSNIEVQENYKNSIDPMKIQKDWRDRYPKLGLKGKYIGDQYMLCEDLPPKAYLRKGATYRLLGTKKESDLQHPHRDSLGNIIALDLDPYSQLASRLCRHVDSKCTFPGIVTIDEHLSCTSVECSMDMVLFVQVAGIYYEYLKPPCVNFPFFTLGEIAKKRLGDGSLSNAGCVDSSLPSVAPYFINHFIFEGNTCKVNAIVNSDGRVSVLRAENSVPFDALTYFRVKWQNGDFPSVENNRCGANLCVQSGDFCVCGVSIDRKKVFDSIPTSKDSTLSLLHIGAVSIDMMDYAGSTTKGLIKAHFKNGLDIFDEETAFELHDEYGRSLFLKNQMINVNFVRSDGSISREFQFRNPPVFHNPIVELRYVYLQ